MNVATSNAVLTSPLSSPGGCLGVPTAEWHAPCCYHGASEDVESQLPCRQVGPSVGGARISDNYTRMGTWHLTDEDKHNQEYE